MSKKKWIHKYVEGDDWERFRIVYHTYYHDNVQEDDLAYLDLDDFLRFIPHNENIYRGLATILWKRFIMTKS